MIKEGLGLNLHSIRNYLETEEKFTDVLEKLKEMGYSYVQFSGAPFDAPMIKRAISKTGMKVVLTHVPMDRILNDTEALMEEHESIGCKNIGLGAMPGSTITDPEKARKTIAALNEAGEKMAKGGFKFFYHNHSIEFIRHDGKSVMEMLADAPYINFTLDTYWVQYAGVSIIDTIKKLSGRIECIHLKDYKIDVQEDGWTVKPYYCPMGDGNIDFESVIKTAREAGTKYFIVEQDNAALLPDTLAQVEKSVCYVKKNLK
ncbi:MAG: sugar phosphate isomerase/epimerase [Clostridia bacterium]|nr:sugar phosphate isomerase/epimerase [Clostridia bacterium]